MPDEGPSWHNSVAKRIFTDLIEVVPAKHGADAGDVLLVLELVLAACLHQLVPPKDHGDAVEFFFDQIAARLREISQYQAARSAGADPVQAMDFILAEPDDGEKPN